MEKFSHPTHTATGETRAWIDLRGLTTLWFNTGTLCNLTCANCYIESSPRNDSLVYLTAEEVNSYLDEIAQDKLPTQEIGFTGGEPFMNPDIIPMIESCLERGFSVLVLTNAMKPMMRCKSSLLALNQRYHAQLTLRISIDHFSPELHEEERGKNTWQPMIDGVQWLVENNFTIDIAGRTRWNDDMDALRQGYAALFNRHKIPVDAQNAKQLMLFPEMDPQAEVPEITTKCWGILGIDPNSIMCASSRMVIKRKGAEKPAVAACTLLPYSPEFELGTTLKQASGTVRLNHPHCAKFCVLGGGSCSAD